MKEELTILDSHDLHVCQCLLLSLHPSAKFQQDAFEHCTTLHSLTFSLLLSVRGI